jgi:hypothetical protein
LKKSVGLAKSIFQTGSAQWMSCVIQIPPQRLRLKQSIEYTERQLQRPLHLSAIAHAVETPVAKVLAVVGEEAIIVLTEARAGAPDYLVWRIR